jgi:pyrroloquinoline quinone (PQQ) biosynthesis protein C
VYAVRSDCRFESFEPSSVAETNEEEFTFQGANPTLFTDVLNRLDGTQSVAEIAAELEASPAEVEAICDSLASNSLAICIETTSTVPAPGSDLPALVYRLFPKWKQRVFSHELWRSLADGSASLTVFKGWLLEIYHFIETVNSRLALAVAECRNPEARSLFLRHYIEEWDHHHFFMSALTSMGFHRDTVLAAKPLPGTLAVVDCMRDAARRDPLFYAACSGFLESTGEDRKAGRLFFERLTKHYCPERPEVVQPMLAHLNLDEEYGHNGLLSQIYPKLGIVTPDRLAGALQAVVQLVETLELWSTDILRTYVDDTSVPEGIPRIYRPGRRRQASAVSSPL